MTTTRDRVAIITGASKGIGAAIAQRLAKDGFAVIVNYASGQQAADQVVGKIKATGGRAIAVGSDIGASDGMKILFDAAEQAFGGVDVLVNNAGIMDLSPIGGVEDKSFERMVSVNIGGVFRGMREAARRLADGGRIVNFSSSVVGMYQPNYGIYAATKAAVEAMTHILAKELGPRGITVNAIAPGPVETELFMRGKSDALVQSIAGMNPFGRLGQPEDIAGVASFLAGGDSGWVNGQVIRANGGTI